MKNVIGFLLVAAATTLFFAFPGTVPFDLKDLWANNSAFGLPVTETACWVFGLTAGFGYLIWWVIGLLFSGRESGFGSVAVLAAVFGSIWYFNGAIDVATLGVTLGCTAYALFGELEHKSGKAK